MISPLNFTLEASTARAAQKDDMQWAEAILHCAPARKYDSYIQQKRPKELHIVNISRKQNQDKYNNKIKIALLNKRKIYNTEYKTLLDSKFNSLLKAAKVVFITACPDSEFHAWIAHTLTMSYAPLACQWPQ